MPRKLANRVLSWLDVGLAAAGHAFLHYWTYVERSYRRPFSWIAFRLKFAFYPLLAIGAVGWLAWDWGHDRSLNAAENAIFDRVINWRLVEPRPSGRVVVVEIDECSIEHFRARGEGGWPWSRQRHADLLERLDRSGVRAVGYDVLFADPSQVDPAGDLMLEAMAAGGADRFLFGSTRLHPDYDAGSPFTAAQVPGAFAVHAQPKANPQVALLLPFGESMARSSAIVNVTRNEDGILRDVPLRETVCASRRLPQGVRRRRSARRYGRTGDSTRACPASARPTCSRMAPRFAAMKARRCRCCAARSCWSVTPPPGSTMRSRHRSIR